MTAHSVSTVQLFCFILLHLSFISLCNRDVILHILQGFQFFGHSSPPPNQFPFEDYLCVWFLMISKVNIQFCVDGSQLTSTPSFTASRCRCTWSCSSSSWLGCQSRDRMRSMFKAYIVWEGITPWWTCIRQMFQKYMKSNEPPMVKWWQARIKYVEKFSNNQQL